MKNKIIILFLAITALLCSCTFETSQQESETPTEQIIEEQSFSLEGIDVDSPIFLIQSFGKLVGKTIDHRLLTYELLNSEISEPITEAIALDMDLSIIYDYGTEVQLRLRDPNLGVFSLYDGKERYLLKNKNICAWIMYVNEVSSEGYYYRGMIEEIDTANNKFMLVDVIDTKPDTWFKITDTCTMTLDDIAVGDYVTVFIEGPLTEEVPADGRAYDVIIDALLESEQHS